MIEVIFSTIATSSFFSFNVFGSIKIEWLFLFFALLGFIFLMFSRSYFEIKIHKSFRIILFYIFYLMFSGLMFDFNLTDSYRVLLSCLFCIFILITLSSLRDIRIDPNKIISTYILLAFFITLACLITFFYVKYINGEYWLKMSNLYRMNDLNPDYYVFETLYGKEIAYKGLHGDPNLVSVSLSFFFYYTIFSKHILTKFMSVIFLFAIAFSLSRGGLASLILGLIVLKIFESKIFSLRTIGLFITSLFGTTIVIILSGMVDKILRGADARFFEWQKIINNLDITFFGNGFNSIKGVIGKQAESGYLHLLYEHGLVGLLLYFFLIIHIHLKSKEHIKGSSNFFKAALAFFYSSVFLNIYTLNHISIVFIAVSGYILLKVKEITYTKYRQNKHT